MLKYIRFISLIFLLIFNNYSNNINNNNSFIIVKKTNNNISPSKLKETIIRVSGDILFLNIKLDQLSLDLRKLLLNEITSGLDEKSDSFIIRANKNQLKSSLEFLNKLKEDLDKQIIDLNNKLSKLKNIFNLSTDNSLKG